MCHFLAVAAVAGDVSEHFAADIKARFLGKQPTETSSWLDVPATWARRQKA